MKFTNDNYTITTIYFDGQFWCALIEKCINGTNYAGKFVFGSEPTNTRLINWMTNEFSDIPVFKVEKKEKIRYKKLAQKPVAKNQIPKSLISFSKAQKEYAESKKLQKRKQKKLDEKEKYLLKQKRKKENK